MDSPECPAEHSARRWACSPIVAISSAGHPDRRVRTSITSTTPPLLACGWAYIDGQRELPERAAEPVDRRELRASAAIVGRPRRPGGLSLTPTDSSSRASQHAAGGPSTYLFAEELGEAPEPGTSACFSDATARQREPVHPGGLGGGDLANRPGRCWRRPATPNAISRGPGDPQERASSSPDTRDSTNHHGSAGEVP